VVEAVVDPNEPLMPGHATLDQSWKFAESLVRGEKDRWEIFKKVLKQQVREVV
jgi:pyruvate dehydrogenase (quinone)